MKTTNGMVDKIVEILKKVIDDVLNADEFEYGYLDGYAKKIAQLYSAGEEVSDEEIIKFSKQEFMLGDDKLPHTVAEAFCIRHGAKWMRSKLSRPTVTEEEIERAWKSWMCTLDNLAKDEQVMLEGDFYAAIKELIDK